MSFQFGPNNNIIRLCMQGMGMEENGRLEEASLLFQEAWSEATDDFESFYAAYFVGRHQKDTSERLKWLERALEFALKINDGTIISALPSLYLNIANCYENLGNHEKAKRYEELSTLSKLQLSDKGPFYHGTKADLQIGDLLTAGENSNYKSELIMNHIYFTAIANSAGLAAALARGDARERVYIVEPMGEYESDPNVTDKKFPGNPTRSYRSREPLKIVGELTDWQRLTPEELRAWRERLANSKGEIIN